jgi:hypothetical protein
MKGKRMGVAIALCAIGLTCASVANAASAPGDNMNYRTRIFLKQLRGCQTSVGLVLSIVKTKPNDLVNASVYVNKGKDICSSIRHRMATMDTTHFRDQALVGEIAVDYWVRGLGRFSDYIDNGRSSDVAKAAEYFSNARDAADECLRGINQRRAVYGLPRLK